MSGRVFIGVGKHEYIKLLMRAAVNTLTKDNTKKLELEESVWCNNHTINFAQDVTSCK